jgi:hypothetical protein
MVDHRAAAAAGAGHIDLVLAAVGVDRTDPDPDPGAGRTGFVDLGEDLEVRRIDLGTVLVVRLGEGRTGLKRV